MPELTRRLNCSAWPLTFDVCGQLISADGFCHHRRRFDCHVLILVLEGTLHITSNGVPRQVQAGEYILLPAGEKHFGHQASQGRLRYLWVHLRGSALAESGCDGISETGFLADTSRVTKRFMQVLEMSLEEPPYPQTMLDYAASLLVMELIRTCADVPLPVAASPAAQAAMAWIRRHYQQPFTVGELAQAVGYQPNYLSSCFKKSTGMSIVQYANGLRLRMAKALLSNYSITIKEAAYSCGFPDEKYFMRLFKQQEGMTPTQFRDLRVK